MLQHPDTHRYLSRQRERELIEEANRERLARELRNHKRASDTQRRRER
ncbi:MAG: hypothetical protein IRY85_00595 [Micromonosporaceae bacterium]|nr:hypothetical protein [Micromonosporaceae bacterium]